MAGLSRKVVEAWKSGDPQRMMDEGMSSPHIAQELGLTRRQARTLWEWHHGDGPPRLYWKSCGKPKPRDASVGAGLRVLVIGDAHFAPRQDMWRASALGRMIVELQPDVVVCIGDWADMPSLSAYDRGKRSFEGRRYVADVEAGNEALALLHTEIDGAWSGRLVWTVGNHEERIERVGADAAEFDGLVGLDDLEFRARGWEVVPFRAPVEIGGVQFAHYFASGVMGRAIGGVSPARSLVVKTHASCVQGHSHVLDYHREVAPDGAVKSGLHVGCFFDHHEKWAGESNRLYWRGIVMLDDCRAGSYDLHTYGMDVIQRRWGGKKA